MSTQILILTAGFGEGHNAAARALATACNTMRGAGTAKVVDAFALASPQLNAVFRTGYLRLIDSAPLIWKAIYAWLDRSAVSPFLLRRLRRERHALARAIAMEQPTLLCSTYPVYGFLLDALNREGFALPPHFSVVTDSISINSMWWRGRCDGWFVPNEDSVALLRQAGIGEQQLYVLGFPVGPRFAEPAPTLSAPDPAHGVAPRVLYMINSGSRRAAQTARRLLTETDWELTCTVGRNSGLGAELTRLAQRRKAPARILGWTDDIPTLLKSHHVVISKAGGATTQEALAARCPMLVNQIVPGQEEGNYELLRRYGVGALANTPDQVLAELHRAFRDGATVWRMWRRALEPLCRPAAASDIALALIARMSADATIPVPMRRTHLPAPKTAAVSA